MQVAHCEKCGERTNHHHVHDLAHGLAGTHMAGSERFTCVQCGTTTGPNDDRAHYFIFVMDKARRTLLLPGEQT